MTMIFAIIYLAAIFSVALSLYLTAPKSMVIQEKRTFKH